MVGLILMGMTVAAIVAIGYPVFVAPRVRKGEARPETDDLQSRKLSVYQDIKDLEFDLEMGKVSGADYETIRTDYEAEAVGILEALDQSGNGRPPGSACPACGEPIAEQDRFCCACGRAIRPASRSKRQH